MKVRFLYLLIATLLVFSGNVSAQTIIRGIVILEASAMDPIVNGQITSDDIYVQWEVDGQDVGPQLKQSPFHFDWNSATVPDGIHTISVRAVDAVGNVGRDGPRTYRVQNILPDTTPPNIVITQPMAGSIVSGKVNIWAQATDNDKIASLELFINGSKRATSNSGNLLYNWNTSPDKKAGSATLRVDATDLSGNKKSTAIAVIIK